MEDKRLFLLDAYALIFRAYYAFIRNPRINSKGLNTSAIFGFVNTLYDILENQDPTHIAVVFDHKSQTFRQQEHAFYKANREETPEDIQKAEPWIREIIKAYHIPILESNGYEADDVIATLAKKAAEEGYTVYMMTPDKDFSQVVDENIYMYRPGRKGKPAEIWDVEKVCERYQLENPEQFIDILGLMGDSVDNIPGVPGVGEKTAMKLIGKYGSIENVYDHIDEIKGKLQERLIENKEQALISKKLATILLDAPVDFEPKKLTKDEPNIEKLKALFAELEFRTLGKRILGENFDVNVARDKDQLGLFAASDEVDTGVKKGKDASSVKHEYVLVDTAEDRQNLIANLGKQKEFAFDTETTGLNPLETEIVGLSFSWKEREAYYVPCPEDQEKARAIVQEFAPVFENESIEKIAHNVKFDLKVLRRYGVEAKGPIYDTMVAHYIAEAGSRHKMDILAENYLGYSPIPIEDLIGKRGKKQKTMRSVPLDKITEYAAEDADITYQLKDITRQMVEEKNGLKLIREVEFPLIKVLLDMEWEGVALDVAFLENFSNEIREELTQITDKVYELAGTQFNLDSPKQLGEVLFDKMKLPYKAKKTKTGQYSTREDILTELKEEHDIIALVLSYRELTKLRSTYVDALPSLINERTGRLHTTFNQTIAATGRLSSLNPNLQNIPIRTERGRQVRKAFIPRDEDHVILSADYSQVELRIIASMSEDPGMIEAFTNDEDIHATTASKVFDVPLDDVTFEMRRQAKAVNFGIAYGQSAFGLSQTLGISRTEAKEIIDNYFEKFPGIKTFMEKTISQARENGYTETLLGRRRYHRDINSKNYTVRSQAERNAINSPIQGSAADLIKVAMLNIQEKLQEEGYASKMTLQVHDELVFDARKDELASLKKMIEHEMKNAIPDLNVPIKVEMGSGENWLEAH